MALDWFLSSSIFLLIAILFLYIKTGRKKKYPPGPIGLPILGYLPFLGPEPHKTLQKLSKQYGSVIGLRLGGRYTVILNDWDSFKEGYMNEASTGRPDNAFSLLPNFGFINKNGKEWIDDRRFSMGVVREIGLGRGAWDNLMREEVNRFAKELYDLEGRPTDISKMLSGTIVSNVLSILIGRQLTEQERLQKLDMFTRFTVTLFKHNAPGSVGTVFSSFKKYLELFKIAGYDKAVEAVKDFWNFVREEISNHKDPDKSEGRITDFISMYLDKLKEIQTKPKENLEFLNEDNLEGNVTLLFLGTFDTILSSFSWMLRLMSKYPNVQEKVRQELNAVLGSEGIATFTSKSKIPYTFAVMKECMRISSVIPISTARRVTQDYTVAGYTLPKDADLHANLWAIHHDPKYWPDPDAFKPERFLADDGTLLSAVESFSPFSEGRRKCPGENIAWMELIAYFTEIFRTFRVTTEPGVEARLDPEYALVTHLKPQALCFHPLKRRESFLN